MRLWSLHPRHLDPAGLVALWRETLLAKAVLNGRTKGYKHHPQLLRFQQHPTPRSAINAYLGAICDEADRRGYSFDRSKVGPVRRVAMIPVTLGQVRYEWGHLVAKLKRRSPALYRALPARPAPSLHPLMRKVPGGIEHWERVG
jgi:hypothetical protein